MSTKIEALKKLYVDQGGKLADVEEIMTVPELIDAIAALPNGGGDIDLSAYAKKTDLKEIENYITNAIENGATIYKTVPTDAELLEMGDTLFYAHGYYDILDGNGGYYFVTTTETEQARKITDENDDTKSVYLIPLDEKGNILSSVNLCRYGVREFLGLISNATVTGSYARNNSDIIESIVLPSAGSLTWKLPLGRFYFERPINLTARSRNLVGAEQPINIDNLFNSTKYKGGTMLVFPFLENGDVAITSGIGNIENVFICGDPSNYKFHIDRTKTTTAPNEVVVETIKQVNSTDYKCIGLKKNNAGHVKNVIISNFYTGYTSVITNIYLMNIKAVSCHFGFVIANDSKCVGVYGWDVHTLLQIKGSIASATQVRVDSCVNAVNIVGNHSKITLVDVDGDYCTDALIKIGDGTTGTEVQKCSFTSIHGRCCALKSYDSVNDDKPSAADLNINNSDGYGVIRVVNGAKFHDNHIQINGAGGNPFDSASDYKLPTILFTFGSGASNIFNNIIVANDDSVEDTTEYIKSLVQTGSDSITYKIETALGTYYVKGSTVTKNVTLTDAQFIQLEQLLSQS